jgi:hypothetical protein
MAVLVASDDPSEIREVRIEHTRRVVWGLERLTADEQIARVRTWLDKAQTIRGAIQDAARAVGNLRGPRRRGGVSLTDVDALIAESARRAVPLVVADVDEHIQRGIDAAHVYWPTCPPSLDERAKLGSVMWIAAEAAVSSHVGRAAWPLANAEYLLISAGMYALNAKTMAPQHVAVLALTELGHSTSRIATALDLDPARVREVRRL